MNGAERCIKNKWVPNTVLRCLEIVGGNRITHYFQITAIGCEKVLAVEVNHQRAMIREEGLLPLDDNDFIGWRNVSDGKKFPRVIMCGGVRI